MKDICYGNYNIYLSLQFHLETSQEIPGTLISYSKIPQINIC